MVESEMLRDLCAHHSWADAEHWRAFEAFPLALADRVLFARLHHLHLTQSAWVWALGGRALDFEFSQPGDFTPRALKDFAMRQHDDLARVGMDKGALERRIGIPWFANPPLELSVGEGLTQLAMHSHYHRGQNAARFRELGGEPPGTDLITWIWKGRPAATWEATKPDDDPRAPTPRDIRCRLAVAAELSALESLQRRASLSNAGDREALLAHPDAIEVPLSQIVNGQVVVAEGDGVLCGFAAILPRDDGAADLDALFVEPRMWRQGIGRILVEHCADVARALGSTTLHVVGNPHAEGFYLACGFVQTATVRTRFGVGLALRRAL